MLDVMLSNNSLDQSLVMVPPSGCQTLDWRSWGAKTNYFLCCSTCPGSDLYRFNFHCETLSLRVFICNHYIPTYNMDRYNCKSHHSVSFSRPCTSFVVNMCSVLKIIVTNSMNMIWNNRVSDLTFMPISFGFVFALLLLYRSSSSFLILFFYWCCYKRLMSYCWKVLLHIPLHLYEAASSQ